MSTSPYDALFTWGLERPRDNPRKVVDISRQVWLHRPEVVRKTFGRTVQRRTHMSGQDPHILWGS